jgi:hypothetical protein
LPKLRRDGAAERHAVPSLRSITSNLTSSLSKCDRVLQLTLQSILRALDLAEHMMIARINSFVAARHAFAAHGKHLARVLLPDF